MMATQAVLKTLTPASASPNKQKRRFNKMMPNTFKRILSAVMALVLMVALLPAAAVTAEAYDESIYDAAVFFSDLHSQEDNYKSDTIKSVFGAVATEQFPVTSVTSCGDAFSVNADNTAYAGDISTITDAIRTAMGARRLPVHYVWSDHDRYAQLNNTLLDNDSGFIYGVGNDFANYYIYELSMADICTNDRYNTGVLSSEAEVQAVISAFKATAQTLDKTKPLFIASHLPLIDRRDDNGYALMWATAINKVAEEMDVVFLSGHNHSHDQDGDYYIAKDSTVNIASTNNIGTPWSVDLEGVAVTLNFTHLTAGYLDPATTGSAGNSRQGTVMVASITDNSIQLTTYCATGEYTGNFAVDESVTRAHAHHHDYSIEVIAPTCTEDGYSIYTCTTCGDWHYADGVDALGHDYTAVVTPPTADTQGYTTYTCKHCYDQYIGDFVDALGHNYKVVVKAPTCTSSGYTSYTCQDCGHRYNDNYVSALGHSYEAEVVAPTCTEQGYTKHTCSNCGDYYKDTYVAAPGHTSTVTVIAPTCTEQGYTQYICQDCGNVTFGNYVAEKGHIYNCVQSGDLLTYSCKNCSYSYSMAAESEYSYNKVTKLVNNNTYVITMYVNKQYYALSHKGNKISAVPVTVANNKVTPEDVTADILWTCKSNKLCYTYNGMTRYLNASSSRLSLSSTGATVSFSSSKLKVGSSYLRYANGSVSLNNTASTTYLFNQVEN